MKLACILISVFAAAFFAAAYQSDLHNIGVIGSPDGETVVAFAEKSPELSYGPGHENHQFAAWDNGDGTHSVACDCGIEKRIDYHADNDSDGSCDFCGYR